jgi:4-hydroxybutyrate CoA-transferase
MKVGVKYCGGCNPRYDRGEFAKRLSSEFRGIIEFENVQEDNKYDALLVISGCSSNCANYTGYDQGKGVIFANNEKSYETVVSQLKQLLNII